MLIKTNDNLQDLLKESRISFSLSVKDNKTFRNNIKFKELVKIIFFKIKLNLKKIINLSKIATEHSNI